jgi:hypothetical protein
MLWKQFPSFHNRSITFIFDYELLFSLLWWLSIWVNCRSSSLCSLLNVCHQMFLSEFSFIKVDLSLNSRLWNLNRPHSGALTWSKVRSPCVRHLHLVFMNWHCSALHYPFLKELVLRCKLFVDVFVILHFNYLTLLELIVTLHSFVLYVLHVVYVSEILHCVLCISLHVPVCFWLINTYHLR